jgi:hypothetical protein
VGGGGHRLPKSRKTRYLRKHAILHDHESALLSATCALPAARRDGPGVAGFVRFQQRAGVAPKRRSDHVSDSGPVAAFRTLQLSGALASNGRNSGIGVVSLGDVEVPALFVDLLASADVRS